MICMMLLTIKLKFNPTDGRHQALLTAMEQFNAALNYTSTVAFKSGHSGKSDSRSGFIATLESTTAYRHS